jgi:hypothetical protein
MKYIFLTEETEEFGSERMSITTVKETFCAKCRHPTWREN